MKCEKCGKEIDYLSIDMFHRDGSDSFETLPITAEEIDGSVCVDVEPNWTGYGLSEEEMPETIRCPECGQFPLENREIHACDMVRLVLFRKEYEIKERIEEKMKDLKPCPFCGGTNLKTGAFCIDPGCYVECECGAQLYLEIAWEEGMTREEHDEACADALLAAWNRRRDAPMIEMQPATDAAPVRHGRWIYGEDIDIQCSVCGVDALTEGDYRQTRSNYCPYCGMELKGRR